MSPAAVTHPVRSHKEDREEALVRAAFNQIAERGFESLDGPVVRVATPDVPIPFSPPLEQAVLPSVERVREACRELLEY